MSDKSGKLVISGLEDYVKMGTQHTKKDKKVKIETLLDRANILSCLTSQWIMVTNLGANGDFGGRLWESWILGTCNLDNFNTKPG